MQVYSLETYYLYLLFQNVPGLGGRFYHWLGAAMLEHLPNVQVSTARRLYLRPRPGTVTFFCVFVLMAAGSEGGAGEPAATEEGQE